MWSLADVGDSADGVATTTPMDYGTPSPGSVRPLARISSLERHRELLGLEAEEAAEGYGAGLLLVRKEREWVRRLPIGLRYSVEEYLVRLDGLFEPKWALTTKLVWTIWAFASAGYTVRPLLPSGKGARRADESFRQIFNVFLPKYLEQKVGEVAGNGGREQSLRDCESGPPLCS